MSKVLSYFNPATALAAADRNSDTLLMAVLMVSVFMLAFLTASAFVTWSISWETARTAIALALPTILANIHYKSKRG